MSMEFRPEDREMLVNLLSKQAAAYSGGPQAYLQSLVSASALSEQVKMSLAGVWSGDPHANAGKLLDWAVAKGINPEDPRYTILGSILSPLLTGAQGLGVGVGEQRMVGAVISAYRLYADKGLLSDLALRYGVPQPAVQAADLPAAPKGFAHSGGWLAASGPEFAWEGPTEPLALQGFFQQEPPFQDVGFLMRGIARAAAVCRIQVPETGQQGTGVLIAPTLVLTNYHVLATAAAPQIEENAHGAELSFGNITAADGTEAVGQKFGLAADKPLVQSSPVDKLDYALLRVEDAIKGQQVDGKIQIAPLTTDVPAQGMGLHILQHPGGSAMKIALSSNGITSVVKDKGLVQYVTRAAGGSSGAPCFNDQWEMIALHHAERATWSGSRREGILLCAIDEEIHQAVADDQA